MIDIGGARLGMGVGGVTVIYLLYNTERTEAGLLPFLMPPCANEFVFSQYHTVTTVAYYFMILFLSDASSAVAASAAFQS